jgi:hypothetical protein
MHEDPTRRMGVPPAPRSGMSTSLKVMIGLLVAMVVGLMAGLVVVADDAGEEGTPVPSAFTGTATQPPATEPPATEPIATTTAPPTDTATATTTETEGAGGTLAP